MSDNIDTNSVPLENPENNKPELKEETKEEIQEETNKIDSEQNLPNNKDNNVSSNLEISRVVEETIGKFVKNKIHYIDSRSSSKSKSLRDPLTRCYQTNFKLTSNIKSFNLPLRINRNSFSIGYDPLCSEKKSRRNKRAIISTSSVFIGGGQSLKGMNLHLGGKVTEKEIRTDNVGMKTTIQTSKNASPEKKLNNEENDINKNIDDLSNLLKCIDDRWKKQQQICNSRLTFITPINALNDKIILHKQKYITDLIKCVKVESKKRKTFVIVKENYQSSNGIIVQDLIATNEEDLEIAVKNFMQNFNNECNEANKENIDTNENNNNNNDVDQKGKKKSKFNHKNSSNINFNFTHHNQIDFSPVIILGEPQVKAILESFPHIKIDNKLEVALINEINVTIEATLKKNEEKDNKLIDEKKIENEKKEEKNLELYPVKVDQFQLTNAIRLMTSNININNNIDVSNIMFNQSDINYVKDLKQIKGAENEYENSILKNKEDFGQCTPISLLQEKYFIYAVSKWAKYSIPNPQSRIYYFNNNYVYKNRPRFFDPLFLDMTNFTLWIERIQLQKKDTKKSLQLNSNIINNFRNKSNSKGINRKKSKPKAGYENKNYKCNK